MPDVSLSDSMTVGRCRLSFQFYQTLATAPSNPYFLGKIIGLKSIDVHTKRGHLKHVSNEHINRLVDALNISKRESVMNVRCQFDTVYDRKYYHSDCEYCTAIKRLHRHRMCRQALEHALNNDFNLKMQIANNAEITKNVLFPMVSDSLSTHGHLRVFPDIDLFELTANEIKDRSLWFYRVLVSCKRDRHFVERLHGIKLIDCNQRLLERKLQRVTLEDIHSLKGKHGDSISMDRDSHFVIMVTVYNPKYYSSKQQFIEFADRLNQEHSKLVGTRDCYVNAFGIDWEIVIHCWFCSSVQKAVRHFVGEQVLQRMNRSVFIPEVFVHRKSRKKKEVAVSQEITYFE